MAVENPLDGIPLPYRLRRTEMKQSPDGDWYVEMTDSEKIVGIDFSPMIQGMPGGGGGGGSSQYPRKPVIWILCDEIVTEVMGQ